jgi:crotonobetainyl-CoA:carnitine CoA-transferase CaiB-like acyl-CoA transferase
MMHLPHSAAQDGYLLPFSRKEAMNPFNNTYQTADGPWIQLCVADYNGGYNHFMEVIGRPDLVDDNRYCNITRLREEGYHREFIEILEEQIAKRTLSEWTVAFREGDIAFEPLKTSLDVLEDPETWANGFVRKITYPTGNERTVFNNPIHIESQGMPDFRPSRGVGADSVSILQEAGYGEEEIRHLLENNVVLQHA